MIKVLIIDDNQDNQENTKELLELAGYEVLLASDGMEGLRLTLEIIPDIILCDIVMPHADGYAVFEQVKENNKTSHIPIIFISANAEKKEVDQALSLGINGYIIKPFEFSELVKLIHQNLKKDLTVSSNSDTAEDFPAKSRNIQAGKGR